MNTIKILLIIYFTFFISSLLKANDLNYEKIGQWNITLNNPVQMVDKSRIMTLFNGGTITFKDGGGKIRDCVEDGHVYSRSVDVNIRCYVEMDDNSTILLEYVAKLVVAESFWDKFGKGEIITPGDGLNYWFGEFKLATMSEKYSWVNDNIIVGKGLEIKAETSEGHGYALYDLYALKH